MAIEIAGSLDVQALEVIEEIGRRVSKATEDPKETMYLFQRLSMAIQRSNALKETMYLFQRLSMAIQRGNALSFFNTFDKNHEIFPLSNNF